MAPVIFEYTAPERFVVGTVGAAGERTFYLQACIGTRCTSVIIEKEQVVALANRITDLLDEVRLRTGDPTADPELAADAELDTDPLRTPVDSEFRVGAMSLSWETERSVVVVECFSPGLLPHDPEPEGVTIPEDAEGVVLRVVLTAVASRLFVRRAQAVVSAGRPPCPLCGGPLNPTGHICPRANGYPR